MIRKVLLVACGALLWANMALAQKSEEFKYSAPKVTLRTNGARLDGTAAQPARISSAQADITALAIAFDFSDSQIQQVRALNQVKIRLDMPGKEGEPVTHVRATSDKATLNPAARQLILEGNVDGYYQVGDGQRTTLAGSQAVLNQVNGQIAATLKGPVRLVIPPETNSPGALGSVVITSQNASIDQAKGQVIFSGDAHAVSADGANQFDVRAPQFTLIRSASGNIDTLTSQGKTHVKIDLPAAPSSENSSGPGKPTHVEVTSDAATIVRPSNTLTFTGNVTGFYVLSQAGQQPQKYDFSGDKAVLTQAAGKEMNAEITGQPVTIFAPGLSFGMK